MHSQGLEPWTRPHSFHTDNPRAERNTRRVVALTAVMMVVEITAGWLFNSMALLADGWHMGTHVAALGVTLAAYVVARRKANDRRFAFGTWKIEVLGGFASAIVLALVALYMAAESLQRLARPLGIHYQEALVVAVVGLALNLISAYLLHNGEHAQGHHGHAHHHGDLNLRAAYIHVLADATTSVLAIFALIGGMLAGWAWLDPIMGIVGAVVISV